MDSTSSTPKGQAWSLHLTRRNIPASSGAQPIYLPKLHRIYLEHSSYTDSLQFLSHVITCTCGKTQAESWKLKAENSHIVFPDYCYHNQQIHKIYEYQFLVHKQRERFFALL